RPAVGSIGFPGGALLVGDHRPGQAKALGGGADVVHVESDIEFAVMHADDFEAVGMIFAVPALDDAEIADAVDAGVLPEVDEHHFAAIVGDVVWDRSTLI